MRLAAASWWPWVVLALSAGPVTTAAAQGASQGTSQATSQETTPGSAADVEAARAAFAAGEAAFDEGETADALEHFRAAFAGSPRPAIRFNIAICLEGLGRFREASEEYDQAALAPELTEELRGRARELGLRARRELGFVEAEGRPAGAGVLVDGERLCVLPCRLELDPGDHTVVAVGADGRRSPETTVTVDRGQTRRATLNIEVETEARERIERGRRGPSALTWIGVGAAVVGTAGTIGFGVYTRDLEAEYATNPSEGLRDRGITAQVLANVSLGVAIVGAVMVAIDLLFFAQREEEAAVTSRRDGAVLRF